MEKQKKKGNRIGRVFELNLWNEMFLVPQVKSFAQPGDSLVLVGSDVTPRFVPPIALVRRRMG